MKVHLIYLFLAVINFNSVCKPNNANQDILQGLDKSYILNKIVYKEPKDFFDEYKIDYSTFEADSINYYYSLKKLINAKTNIIEVLLSFENDKLLCNWIKTKSPYSSTVYPGDMVDKSTAAKILIDNYILGNDKIITNSYVHKVEYSWLKSWYKKSRNKEDLKKEYQKYIQTL